MGDTNNNLQRIDSNIVVNNSIEPVLTSTTTQDFTTQYIKFVAKTSGRDKLCRLIQYSSKFVWWHLQRTNSQNVVVQKLKALDSSISTSRKMFRMGKSFEVIQSTLNSLHIKDPLLRTFVSMAKINNALYLLFDNLIWLDRVGLIKVNRGRMSELSAKFWLASILCSITRDIYQLWTLISEEEQKGSHGSDFVIVTCLLKNKSLLLDLIRNAADVPLPMAMLKRTDLSPGSIGLLGVISTYIGILTEWNPDYKVVPS